MKYVPRSAWARISLVTLPLFVLALLGFSGLATAQDQRDQRCFPETGECISGRIRTFWEENGGLAVFGYPITAQAPEATRDGTFESQWFERTRLELHPENAAPYDVLLGRAGDIRLLQEGRDWFTFPKADAATRSRSDCHYFPETDQSVCGVAWRAYRSHGLNFDGNSGITFAESLALFGLPLSSPQLETNSSGDTVWTQWFERARFEYHPENAEPYDVLFGRLGAEILSDHVEPVATATPEPPTPTPGPGPDGCSLQMTFDRDRAVPNGTTLAPGAEFTRIWRVRNDGTCQWQNYRLVFSRGDQMGGPASVRVPSTEPGALVDISVPLVAPSTPGTYRGFWVMQASNGSTFGGLVVEIVVASNATSTPTVTPTATTPAETALPTAIPTATTPAATPEPTATTEPTATPSPVGPVWQWQSTQLNDGTTVTAIQPERYTLQLNADGSLAVRADCNQIIGSYQLNGSNLTLSLGPSTTVACGDDSQVDQFAPNLSSVSSFTLNGSTLTLQFSGGTMRLTR